LYSLLKLEEVFKEVLDVEDGGEELESTLGLLTSLSSLHPLAASIPARFQHARQ
jgi:hypothetical protein